MSNPPDRVEIITSVQRRRRWTGKVRIVEETFEPGMTVSLVTRRHGVAPNQLFTWRRLVMEGALTAAGGEQVMPASDYRALQSQVRELQRLLGKKTLEAEILKEAGLKKTAAGCRRRGRRTVRDEDRGGGDCGLPFQSDRTHARATEETAGRRCQTKNSCRRSSRSSSSCQPTATGVSTPSSSAKRWPLA
jgi:transposase